MNEKFISIGGMMTKIDDIIKMIDKTKKTKRDVKRCLQLDTGIEDQVVESHSFSFVDEQPTWKPAAIYLEAYYRDCGNCYLTTINNKFYHSCLIDALNNLVLVIVEETEKVMSNRIQDELLQAKEEAKHTLKMCDELKEKEL